MASKKRFFYSCKSLADIRQNLKRLEKDLDVQSGELLWFRGCSERTFTLLPSLMRDTHGLSDIDHDQVEQDLFFEFQARAHELRLKGLSDWECLFYGRHYGLPTRVMDWSDTLGIALYFATEGWVDTPTCRPATDTRSEPRVPAIWVLNPVGLNDVSLGERDIWLPRRLGYGEDGYTDFGDLLLTGGSWGWKTAAAIYPIQINERVRAQRGWFTIHGDDRRPLEDQLPHLLGRLELEPEAVREVVELQDTFGVSRFSIFPDLENLAGWLRSKNSNWIADRRR